MPARSSVSQLPPELRSELDRRLIAGSFSDYSGFAEWLQGEGFEISRSSVHRYGSRLEKQIAKVRASTEMAAAFVEATPDDSGAMADASIRLVQDRMFDFLLEAEGDDLKALSNAAKAVAAAAHASARIRSDRRKILADTKKAVARTLDDAEQDAGKGVDPLEAIRRVREEIYGIFNG